MSNHNERADGKGLTLYVSILVSRRDRASLVGPLTILASRGKRQAILRINSALSSPLKRTYCVKSYTNHRFNIKLQHGGFNLYLHVARANMCLLSLSEIDPPEAARTDTQRSTRLSRFKHAFFSFSIALCFISISNLHCTR